MDRRGQSASGTGAVERGYARRDVVATTASARHYAGAVRPARYRFWPLRWFPYLLVYDADSAPPHVVRFIHTARDLPAALEENGGLQG
jgi:hypothetical protein